MAFGPFFLAIISLTALSDLGLAGTLTKHVAEYYARRDNPALNRLVDTGLMLYILIAALLAGALCIASRLLIPLFFVSPRFPTLSFKRFGISLAVSSPSTPSRYLFTRL